MLIRDLERKTGLDRATIRYYEREGLIAPERKENGYRVYSNGDCDTLRKIKLLRQLGMSLERIKALQAGSADLQDVLTEQTRVLDKQIRDAEQARRVCMQMLHDRVSYGDMNAAYYQNCFCTQPALAQSKPFREPVTREYHPVLRFLARWMDYCLITALLRFLLIAVFDVRPYPDWLNSIDSYAVAFLMVPLGALMLHFWGTTPGKWCMGLRVESENGGKLSYQSALEREWDVLRYGCGFWIPLWNCWCLYRSYRAYREREPDWDWEAEYRFQPWDNRRKAGTAGLILAVAVLIAASVDFQMQPKYKGELTVAQFASNYNYYLALVYPEHDKTQQLQPDGTPYPLEDNTVVIHVFGEPEKVNASFEYVLEGEKLSEIRYSNLWTNVLLVYPIPAQCQYASVAAVMAQEGANRKSLTEFAALWDAEIGKESVQIEYGGIRIRWNVDYENCIQTSDGNFMRQDESRDSWVRVDFVIELE